ncbi:hypothetical protein DVA67_021975 [Solirubrobacter sp. CPCC 204708]|uniref:Uncharacterized protein n=1 Tax=Solirubrobacter deserti TaxID=2282478 RepID=A0ABT4RFH7_9ACTN|nr:hypothetical protein [Solirubrobacter deserti]MBE2318663.1 hypothetical protein [Solirubrobacter deserti]MDA0137121.1 hypothetical protein [Solirubrobacter deserti]
MRLDTSLLQGISAANTAASKAQQSSSLKTTGTSTTFSSALKTATSASEKESTKPVEGENYAEILTGPRAGMYINKSGNARDGEAFILVKGENGKPDQHIYGTGKDRTVVSSGGDGEKSSSADKSSSKDKSSATGKAPSDETVKQLDGRGYADILTGSRNGLYLNTSGNVRDGQVFTLVKREGREYHIYGTGKDRQVIGLRPKSEAADQTPATTDKPTETTTPSTGTGTPGSGQLVDTATT